MYIRRITKIQTLSLSLSLSLIQCRLYSDLRQKYISDEYTNCPSMYKFIQLMKIENTAIIRNLTVCVYKAFQVRNTGYMRFGYYISILILRQDNEAIY